MVVVRRVESRDASELKRVRLAALRDTPSAFGSRYEAEVLMTDAEWEGRARAGSEGSERSTFFADVDGAVVGLVGGFRAVPNADTVDLVSMWVAPHKRRCGIARQLVGAIVDWAIDTGATHVALWVTDGNAPATSLYQSMGFVLTGNTQPLPWAPSTDELELVLPLRSS